MISIDGAHFKDEHGRTLILRGVNLGGSSKVPIATYKQQASQFLGGTPVLIGEFGIPFDLTGKKAYTTNDFDKQIQAMDRFRALEDNLLSGTLWNYTADNTNARGDLWNGEDFSIFSRDQQTNPKDIPSGGRTLPAVVRAYARAVAGAPLRLCSDTIRGPQLQPNCSCPITSTHEDITWRFRMVPLKSIASNRCCAIIIRPRMTSIRFA